MSTRRAALLAAQKLYGNQPLQVKKPSAPPKMAEVELVKKTEDEFDITLSPWTRENSSVMLQMTLIMRNIVPLEYNPYAHLVFSNQIFEVTSHTIKISTTTRPSLVTSADLLSFTNGCLSKMANPSFNETNRQLILKSRPQGLINESTFQVQTLPIPQVEVGQVLIRVKTISIDPSMRLWLERKTYIDQVPLDAVMFAGGIGEVVQSRSEKISVGDLVNGMFGCQEWSIMDATKVFKIPSLPDPNVYLHVLGGNGLTAYFGLFDIGKPKAGEQLVVSTAAGAVGSLVVQLGKMAGCKVVGIAGSDEKCAYVVKELGADFCINYKTTNNLRGELSQNCPNGIDVYFDNVGADQLDACMSLINMNGRIVACGAISGYNTSNPPSIRNYSNLIVKAAKYQGFIVLYYAKRFPQAIAKLKEWLDAGKLKYKHTIVPGLERVPEAMNLLFTGKNEGKVMVSLDQRVKL